MPSGDDTLPDPGQLHEIWMATLRSMLEDTTVQGLRQAARHWGWTLRGTAKADLVEQMVGYLGDSARMAAAIQSLPDEELAVLSWLAALGGGATSAKQLQAALAEASGLRIALKTIDLHVQSLVARCLVFNYEYSGLRVPDLYRQWLPRPDAPKLLFPAGDRLQQPAPLTIASVTQHVQHLLGALAVAPAPATVAPKQVPRYTPPAKASPIDPRRPYLVSAATLTRWGYASEAEQHLARFLLERMITAGLCHLTQPPGEVVLAAADPPNPIWEMATPAERLQRLRRSYLTLPKEGESRLNSWSEWDVVFAQGHNEGLLPPSYWLTVDGLLQQTNSFGVWLANLVASLQVETWYGIEPFCKLIYQVQRDLTLSSSHLLSWKWMIDGETLEGQKTTFARWMQTYGRLVTAWLTGPANWLLFVQIGFAGGQPVAFRRPREAPAGVAQQAPAGSLRFMADGMIGLNNDWRASDLRRLLRLISVEVARNVSTTLLRMDAGAVRNSLQAGQSAAAVNEAFTAAGFPLPPAAMETLETWQQRAGRYQLYEQLAVVEFGEDVLPEELRAISRLSGVEYFQPGPRCLIFPDPQAAPALVEELRRRGYTPQVLP